MWRFRPFSASRSTLLSPLLFKSFPRPVLLFLSVAFTFASPSAFPICPSLSHIRSVSARIQNMSECRLVNLRFFFLGGGVFGTPHSSVMVYFCLLPPPPLFPCQCKQLIMPFSYCIRFFFFSSLMILVMAQSWKLRHSQIPSGTEPLSFNFQIPEAP